MRVSQKLLDIFKINDGSLPDIEFNFAGKAIVDQAYKILQTRSSHLVSKGSYYWSISKQVEIPISFTDNPAKMFLVGEAESFHVVFGGVKSKSGFKVPDLGIFVLEDDFISLNYRMGSDWNNEAVLGLFELMFEIDCLDSKILITHNGNVYDEDLLLLKEYCFWKQYFLIHVSQ